MSMNWFKEKQRNIDDYGDEDDDDGRGKHNKLCSLFFSTELCATAAAAFAVVVALNVIYVLNGSRGCVLLWLACVCLFFILLLPLRSLFFSSCLCFLSVASIHQKRQIPSVSLCLSLVHIRSICFTLFPTVRSMFSVSFSENTERLQLRATEPNDREREKTTSEKNRISISWTISVILDEKTKQTERIKNPHTKDLKLKSKKSYLSHVCIYQRDGDSERESVCV